MMRHHLWAVVGCLALMGCPGPGAADGDSDLDPCEFPAPVALELEIGPSFSSNGNDIQASVLEWPDPTLYEVHAEQGSCRHMILSQGLCDPACDYDEVCTADAECVAYPANISAGLLTVEGLFDEPYELEAQTWNEGLYYEVELDGEPATGAVLEANFSGGTFPAVEFAASGVAAFDPGIPSELEVPTGQDLVLSWGGPEDATCVELRLHGMGVSDGAPLQDAIWCVADDTGSLTVPGALFADFPLSAALVCDDKHGWCPRSEISRYTRQTVATDGGAAQISVRSAVDFRYDHH
jgi:hypothetical protein